MTAPYGALINLFQHCALPHAIYFFPFTLLDFKQNFLEIFLMDLCMRSYITDVSAPSTRRHVFLSIIIKSVLIFANLKYIFLFSYNDIKIAQLILEKYTIIGFACSPYLSGDEKNVFPNPLLSAAQVFVQHGLLSFFNYSTKARSSALNES